MKSISEDIHSQIDKVYPEGSEHNKDLHASAKEAQNRAKQAEMEKDLGKHEFKPAKDLFSFDFDPEDEKRIEKEQEWETKKHFKPMSKDEIGKRDNYISQFGTSDKEEIAQAKVARRALGKRKAKMNKNEALEIVKEAQEILCEKVEATSTIKRSKPERKQIKKVSKVLRDMEKLEKKYTDKQSGILRQNDMQDDYENTKNTLNLHRELVSGPNHLKVSQSDKGYKIASVKEALEIVKEAQEVMSSIFEVDYEGKKDKIDVNKISREKKDKDGEKVDVVSVADELFPAEGNAKEQYNQKIIAKINDMIEGKATLEDLIQLVRQKGAAKKAAVTHESIDKAVELLEGIISEMKPETYGKVTGKRAELAAQDINKEREIENKYNEYKKANPNDKEGLEKIAQEWNKVSSDNKFKSNSNVNKYSKDVARSSYLATKNNWSSDGIKKFNDAVKAERKTDLIGGKPYKHVPRWSGESLDEAVNLLEEMINEVSRKYVGKKLENSASEFKRLEDEETKLEQENAPKEEIEKATTKKVKYGHKIFPAIDRIAQKLTKRPEED